MTRLRNSSTSAMASSDAALKIGCLDPALLSAAISLLRPSIIRCLSAMFRSFDMGFS